jgi:hypothetical protein
MNISKATVALVALVALGTASARVAVADPSALPSYATAPVGEETIHGRVASVVDKYKLTVDDERGFVDDVTLHDGTVINPTGVTLEPGQPVTIVGHADGRTFAANEIDVPPGDTADYGYDDGYAAPYPYPPAYPYWYGPWGYDPGIAFGFYGGGYGYGHWHGGRPWHGGGYGPGHGHGTGGSGIPRRLPGGGARTGGASTGGAHSGRH